MVHAQSIVHIESRFSETGDRNLKPLHAAKGLKLPGPTIPKGETVGERKERLLQKAQQQAKESSDRQEQQQE